MSNSVKKAFTIIDCIAENKRPVRLVELSSAVRMNKTTVFRYLETLQQLQIVEKKGNFYHLGLRLFELGTKVMVKNLLIDKIRPFLKELSAEVNETVNLAMLYQGKALYLEKAESKRSLQIKSKVGDTLPLYCTGLGKSILSILSREECNKIVQEMEIIRNTKYTIIQKEDLFNELENIHEKGYSTDNQEFEYGLTCVAVPLKMEYLDFYGGISISGTSDRFKSKNIKLLVKKLKNLRKEVHRKLL